MGRRARVKSRSNIYHIILRGVNRQQIFLDPQDEEMFMSILRYCKRKGEFRLYAYCLMGNHVHLLMKADGEPIGQIMRKINTRYALWFNTRYERSGHLFQDRYRSEPVQEERYFLTVLRYILHNPVKAGMCKNIFDYRSSSANDYLTGKGITDTEDVRLLMGDEDLIDFLQKPCREECMEFHSARQTDSEALRIISDLTGERHPSYISRLNKQQLREILPQMRKRGLSIRQISRLTGLSIKVVRNISG